MGVLKAAFKVRYGGSDKVLLSEEAP